VVAEAHDRLTHRHEVAPVVLVGALDGLPGLAAYLVELGSQRLELGLELEDALDPGQVQAVVGEVLDAAQERDVVVAVATASAFGSRRLEQPLALVDAQGLRMDTGELGGDRDDVHRPLRAATTDGTHVSLPS
jgi:hypothetical protein